MLIWYCICIRNKEGVFSRDCIPVRLRGITPCGARVKYNSGLITFSSGLDCYDIKCVQNYKRKEYTFLYDYAELHRAAHVCNIIAA